jgi:hypothetical protein
VRDRGDHADAGCRADTANVRVEDVRAKSEFAEEEGTTWRVSTCFLCDEYTCVRTCPFSRFEKWRRRLCEWEAVEERPWRRHDKRLESFAIALTSFNGPFVYFCTTIVPWVLEFCGLNVDVPTPNPQSYPMSDAKALNSGHPLHESMRD